MNSRDRETSQLKMTVSGPTRSSFLNWNGKPIRSHSKGLAIYHSLVQVVKDNKAFSPSLVDKAVLFLRQIELFTEKDVDSFVFGIVPTSQLESSSATLLKLVSDGLVPQLISSLNPLTLSFADADDIHIHLMRIID
ncbi:hypothetical protein BLNAU_23065 [Blattamonas nauphoetae]|uniref:Uncharacterized protein n=1 Tax=Blattamonas nauphoetae TaxID=2049346 RepID=A0ABQ9WUD2_9EUKA|nr:hypothetical protein BLNAU_23065 [Blattamonas nauphoetae]